MTNLRTIADVYRNHPSQKSFSMIGRYSSRKNLVPEGLILPYNGVSAPDGWTAFTDSDGKMIVGAGSTYGVKTSAGSNSFSVNTSLGSAGAHSSGPGFASCVWSSGTNPNQSSTLSAGAHGHNVIGTQDYNPLCNDLMLIKADSASLFVPKDAVLLSTGEASVPDLSNVFDNNRFLKSNSSLGETGSSTVNIALSTAGAHGHTSGPTYYFASYIGATTLYNVTTGSGNHSGTVDVTIAEAIKKVLLSAWTNASSEYNLRSSVIGMYESLTPPSGWVLCDGNNSTPDLRDYFINTVESGSENTTGSGDNTIDASSSSVNHGSSHSHQGSVITNSGLYLTYPQHSSYAWSHTHGGFADNDKAYLPAYYSLAFIMKE